MSKNKSLTDLFIDELQDMYDAENRIVKALPKLVKAATSDDLKEAFESHLEETKGHVEKLEEVFKSIGEKAKAKECKATVGLLKEGDEIAADFKGSSAINAALISAGQKVEHYEIASYGCLIEWAEALGHSTAVELLGQILDEEKAADEKLTSLARDGANDEALEGADDEETLEKSKDE
jgi:ferritin-like metal-binding protein YciE